MHVPPHKPSPENWRDGMKDEAPESRIDLSDSLRRLDMLRYAILRCTSKIKAG